VILKGIGKERQCLQARGEVRQGKFIMNPVVTGQIYLEKEYNGKNKMDETLNEGMGEGKEEEKS